MKKILVDSNIFIFANIKDFTDNTGDFEKILILEIIPLRL